MDVRDACHLLCFDDQKKTPVSRVTFASILLVTRKIGRALDVRTGQSDAIFVERGRWMFASLAKKGIAIVDMIFGTGAGCCYHCDGVEEGQWCPYSSSGS